MHSVSVVLISFILRGRGKHYLEDLSFEEKGKSIAVTHYGQEHSIVTASHSSMDIINIYLDLKIFPLPTLPPTLQKILPNVLPLHPKFQNSLNRIIRLEFDDISSLEFLAFKILKEQSDQEAGFEDSMRLLFRMFLIECCRHALRNGLVIESAFKGPTAQLEKVRQHLDHHFEKAHTLDSLCKISGLSRSYLCHAFKDYTGKTLTHYLNERRIEAAMMELRTMDEKISNLALDVGFQDLSYFNRTFHRITGSTPGAYRKRYLRKSR